VKVQHCDSVEIIQEISSTIILINNIDIVCPEKITLNRDTSAPRLTQQAMPGYGTGAPGFHCKGH